MNHEQYVAVDVLKIGRQQIFTYIQTAQLPLQLHLFNSPVFLHSFRPGHSKKKFQDKKILQFQDI